MIIDCHGHYTTAPPALWDFRRRLLEAASAGRPLPSPDLIQISDDEIVETIEGAQLRLQRERGTDLTIFSPQASAMAHHEGGPAVSGVWSTACNDLIGRVCRLYPENFAAVCQLPQAPGIPPANCVNELRRCVQMGFVGCNLNPDPSGGFWTDLPLTDEWWYPLYEEMVELAVPAMIHVSASCNPNFHTTGAHYLSADTAVFMQLLTSDLFERFPTLQFVIPHGGGAVPYHWGRYRGMAQELGLGTLDERVLGNVYFDTCVYHSPGVRLLAEVIPAKNILFASEMVGAVRGIDPTTGHYYDDTRRYVDELVGLTEVERTAIFEHNARRVYPGLNKEPR